MRQTSTFLLILTILLAVETTTSRAQVPPGNWKRVYTNQEFTSPIRLDDLDSVLFYNCTRNITEAPYALRLTNCTNVLVRECKFSDIQTKSGGRVLEIDGTKVDEWTVSTPPTAEQLTIEGSADYQVTLYDPSGRPVVQHNRLRGRTTLDVSHLRPGVYLMKMHDAQQHEVSQRIII